MSVVLPPDVVLQFQNPNNPGNVLAGGKLFTYQAGTTTKQATWTDSTQTTQNPNPIILDNTGSCVVWGDPTLLYKFVLAPANDTDPPTSPLRTVDNIAFPLTAATTTAVIIGNILYPQIAAEAAAFGTLGFGSVVNPQYYYCVPDRYGTNTTPGTTDMTNAIKVAYAVHVAALPYGPPVQFLAEKYLISGTCITVLNAHSPVVILGVNHRSVLLNAAAAGTPAINITGGQFFTIRDLTFIANTAYVNSGSPQTQCNTAIQITKDGSANRAASGYITGCCLQPNGIGIYMTDCQTILIENCEYWGNPTTNPNYGNSFVTGGMPGAVWAAGTGQVNEITIRNLNVSGLDTVANGGCAVKADGSAIAAFNGHNNWCIENLLSERGSTRAIWIRNCAYMHVRDCYVDGADSLRIDWATRYVIAENIYGGSTGTYEVDGTQNGGGGSGQNGWITFRQCGGASLTIDANNINISEEHTSWATSYTNSASFLNRRQGNLQGQPQADREGTAGVGYEESSTAQSLSNGSTLFAGVSVQRITMSGAVTGIIVSTANGTGVGSLEPGQRFTILNESAFTATMAVAGTSNCANGASVVVPALGHLDLVWDAAKSLWY